MWEASNVTPIRNARLEMVTRQSDRLEWAQWVREGQIPDDEENELWADWDADVEVLDLLIARWDSTVLRRLGAFVGR